MSQILHTLSPLGLISGRSSQATDDDLVDRLSHSHTVLLLIIFSIVVSTKQYVGDPIQCWVPTYFSSNYVDYTNKICWVSNTYYLPFEDPVKREGEPRRHLVYYQWVPLILVLQALLFYVPYMIWKTLNTRSGVDVNSLVEAARSIQQTDNREKTIRYIIRSLDRYVGSFHNGQPSKCCARWKDAMARKCSIFCGRKYGNYLILLYMFIKLLYAGNAVGQLFLLNTFLGSEYYMYGVDVFRSLIYGEEWPGSQRFPRVTMCDFRVRQMGNVQHYTVQCVLPINLFNEKIFLIVWFWFVFLALITGIWWIVWAWRALARPSQFQFIKHHLKSLEQLDRADDTKTLNRFVFRYLRADGVLVLRLVNYNTNNLVTSEIIGELWNTYKKSSTCWNRRLLREADVPDV